MEETRKKYERFRYTQETLEKALKAILNGEITLNKASKSYNIPKSTLSNKITNKVPWQRKMGPMTELTFDEEIKLAEWILAKAKLGFPMHPEEVYDTVQVFLNANDRASKFTENRPGKKWLSLFLKRHPEVTKRNAEIISKARAAVTEEAIRNWFSELEKFLEEENATDIKDDPTRIFNADETGVMTCPKTGLILGPKNFKNTYEVASGKEKESITVLCTFSADGNDVPPFVVYPYKRMPPAVAQNFPDSWFIGRSDSGWMVSATFFAFIKLFYEWLLQNDITLPVLLFLDGHKSHINQQMFDFCREKGIMIFCLYPNSTHILQPCDVGIFGPMKKAWKKVVRKHKQRTTALITKQNFAPKFKEAYDNGVKSTTIKKSFRACGLYPVNPDAVDYSRCIQSRRQEIFEQRQQDNRLSNFEQRNDDLRSTIKVIETEVGQITRNEFIASYNLNQSHPHQFFALWVKCKRELENKSPDYPTTPDTTDMPLDLSASSLDDSALLTESNTLAREIRQSSLNSESNDRVLDTVPESAKIIAQVTASGSMVTDSLSETCSESLLEPTRLFEETELFGDTLPLFNTTNEIVEFIVNNEISLPDVITLPWHKTPEKLVEDNSPKPQSTRPPFPTQASPTSDIPSNAAATDNDLLPELTTAHDVEMEKAASDSTDGPPVTTIPNMSRKAPLESFLKYPEIQSTKTKTMKKPPAPFGLTGLKCKEYLQNQEDIKKKKQEEIENRKKTREEEKLIRKRKSEVEKEERQKRKKKDKNQIKKTGPNKKQNVTENRSSSPMTENLNQNTDTNVQDKPNSKENVTEKWSSSPMTDISNLNIATKMQEQPNDKEVCSSLGAENLRGKYVVAQFKTSKRMRHFIGEVLVVNDERQKCKIDFLRKKTVNENVIKFAKPLIPDIAEVDFVDIKRVLSEPSCSRRGIVSFENLKFKDIE